MRICVTSTVLIFSIFLLLSISSCSSTIKGVDVENPVVVFTPSHLVGSGHGSIDVVLCERIRVSGISRLKLGSYASAYRVTLVPSVVIPEKLYSKIQICFHKNASLGLCQCEMDSWKAVQKGLWNSVMSPYEDRYLDVNFVDEVSGSVTVTVEEEFQQWRVFFLALGFVFQLLAPIVSSWVPFYYSSSMAIGVFLVIIILLFQGMKLLPTGRKNILYLTIYGSVLGAGSFFIHHFSMLVDSILLNFGLSEEMHNPITSIRLNGDNFLRWSQFVRMYIRGRGKIGYLIADKKAPTPQDPTYATWDAENSMVMTWLVNSMDEDISSNYMCYPTTKELWDNINQMYSDLGNQSQVYELTLKLGEIRQGDGTVPKYFNSLKRLCQDLDLFNDYEWKSAEDANHNRKIVEAHRIYKFLAGLNVEFDEVRSRIIGRLPLPLISEVFAEVRREESRRNVMLGKKGTNGNVETSVLIASDVVANKAVNYQRKIEEKPQVWCDHCNKPRHTRDTCWKIHGKLENWKSRRTGDRSSRTTPSANEAEASPFGKEQMDHLLKLLKSSSSSGISNVSLAQTGSELGEEDWQC